MCTISINQASLVATPIGSNASQISLSGTVANCTSQSVWVEVACQGIAPSRAQAVISGNTWTVTLQSKCPCGTPITITAVCNDTPPCTDTFSPTLICNCCPTIKTRPICIEYRSGKAFVKFITDVTVPNGCGPITAQRDFGDGTLGSLHTYTTGQNSTANNLNIEIHSYNTYSFPYNVTSTVHQLSPPSCPPTTQVTFTIDPPPPCSVSFWVGLICNVARFLFLLYASAGVVSFVASFTGCLTFNSALTPIALGFAAGAGFFLLILWLACRKCMCDLLLKLLGQLLMVLGVIFSMFILQTNCFSPSMTAMILLTAALLWFGYLILRGWYGQACCPVSICDFWRAIIDAMLVAFVGALLVFLILQGGVAAFGIGLALLLAYLIMAYASLQVTNNTAANNC